MSRSPSPSPAASNSFFVATGTSQPGDGALTVTLRKNGQDTTLTIAGAGGIVAGAAAGTYSVEVPAVSVIAGDLISIKAVVARRLCRFPWP